MDELRLALKVVHFISWAALLGGILTQFNVTEKRLTPSAVWGARLMFLTGLILVGVKEMLAKEVGGTPVNHMKIGIKLLLGLIALGIVEMSRKKGLQDGTFWAVLVTSLIAIGVAVFIK
jgi:hypothetical protein